MQRNLKIFDQLNRFFQRLSIFYLLPLFPAMVHLICDATLYKLEELKSPHYNS